VKFGGQVIESSMLQEENLPFSTESEWNWKD